MSQITRGWPAFAAIGTAVIHLALVMGSPLPLAIVLAALGIVELGWGVLALSRDRVMFPRAARIGALAPVILWSVLVVAATVLGNPIVASYFNFIPMAVATLFELFIAIAISTQLRRETRPSKPTGSGRYLLGMLAGALLVAGLTAPALAFTQAGLGNARSSYFDTSGDPGHAGH